MGYNTNILHWRCCRAELWSFRIKCYLSQEYLMKNKWVKHIWDVMSERLYILPTKPMFYISSAGKIKSMQEFKINLFEKLFQCKWQPRKNCMATWRIRRIQLVVFTFSVFDRKYSFWVYMVPKFETLCFKLFSY